MNKLAVLGVVVALAAAAGWFIYGAKPAPGAGAGALLSGPAASGAAPGASAAGAPVSVTTVVATKRDMVVTLDANGTVTPLNQVDIRPQVSSIVAKVHVREGQFVKAGDLLFTLDSRADEVNVAKARAQVQKDEAALADAQRQFARSKDLFRQQFVSQSAVDTSQTLVESAQAVVASSRAALEATRVALGYGRIAAPSAGRVGAITVYAGSYVQPSGTLVTITQLDPIGVAFSVPQRNLGDALAGLRGGTAPVAVQLPEARGELLGRLQFVDSAIDTASGNVRVKAQFDNRDSRLWPGAYVQVRMGVRTLKDVVVVPQAAVIQSPRGTIVYVVEQGKAAARRIEVSHASGSDAAVTGLAGGERVILEGRQNVRPGSPVAERSPGEAGKGGARARAGADPATGAASGGASGGTSGTPSGVNGATPAALAASAGVP